MAFWGVIRALVKHKHMLFPPSLQLPTYMYITEDLPGSWLGRYMKMDKPLTTQSVLVQYCSLSSTNKLPPPSLLRPSTRHARLHGVLGQKSMYAGQWSPPPPLPTKI